MFYQKNPKVLFFIKRMLGFGSIHQAKDGYWTFTVTSFSEIKILMNLLNGKLLLNKTNTKVTLKKS